MSAFGKFPLRWIDHQRGRRVAELLAITWLFSLVDLVFTLWAHLCTPFREMNPIAQRFLQHGYLSGLVVYKLALMLLATGIFWAFRNRRSTEAALWILALAYVLLMLRWSSYTGSIAALQ